MDDSKSVDLVITCFFEDHCVDDGFPSVERVSGSDTEIDNCENRSTNKGLFFVERRLAWNLRFGVRKRFDKQRFIMSEVSSRWRCGGGFAPYLDFPLEFFF